MLLSDTAMRRVRAVREHPHQSTRIVVDLERFPVSSSLLIASATDCVPERASVRAIEPDLIAVTGTPHRLSYCDRGDVGLDSYARFNIGHSFSLSHDWPPSSKSSDSTLMAGPLGILGDRDSKVGYPECLRLPSAGESMAGIRGREIGTRSESTEPRVYGGERAGVAVRSCASRAPERHSLHSVIQFHEPSSHSISRFGRIGVAGAVLGRVLPSFASPVSPPRGATAPHPFAGHAVSTRNGVCRASASKSASQCRIGRSTRMASAAIRQSMRTRTVSPWPLHWR